jgi:hypothetical protein
VTKFKLDVTRYSSVDIKLSDHRPGKLSDLLSDAAHRQAVFALMRANVKTVNAEKRGQLSEEILKQVSSTSKANGAKANGFHPPRAQSSRELCLEL